MRTTRRIAVATSIGGSAVVVLAGPALAQEDGDGGGEDIGHAEEECIHILEDGGTIDECQESPNPILPETNELIWGAISFVVLFVLLAKLAYPPIKQALQDRTDRIQGEIDAADQTKSEADRVLEEYRGQLADAKSEAGRIIEEARQSADAMRTDIIARAESDAADRRRQAESDLDEMLERTRADLQARVADLSIELAERVVEHSLDRETNLALIERYINDLESQGS